MCHLQKAQIRVMETPSMSRKFLLCSLIAGWTIGALHAGPLFDGPVRYQFLNGNRQVVLSHTKIVNDSHQQTTGTIQISLWAMDYPYEGGAMDGFRIASYKLEGLKPGYEWNAAEKTLPTVMPEWPDYYLMAMTLEEYHPGGYRITDWINFDSSAYLDPPPPPAPKPLLSMEGPYRWQTYPTKGTILVKTGKINHTRNGNTGSLRIAVWATQQPYRGGRINGYILGTINRDPLQKGMMYPKTNQVVRYKAPPSGNYYVTLTLSAYDGQVYKIMDHFTFDGTTRF